ncbi:lung adenoma susceptibility protein 2 isoform X4 [Amblyraja radiata]|uniref:lung adenoma susceptibility protein 2 isoform X4 n=1 Tax=Amblyraja radiata TaxID=386614 RepID=UPI001402FC04|nr:lung adenoma susceptibility protein 2 isoform X4 [Amblyraja radiata]
MTPINMDHGLSFHSPDSTLSKLTGTSYGNGCCSQGSTQFPSSVLYRGINYQSASEALEAYIDNFENKLSSPYHANKLHSESSSKLFSTSPHNREEEEHIDLLIQKAEYVLDALSQQVRSQQENPGSPGTEEVLDADRSWDNPPITFKSPVPVGDSGEDCFDVSNPAQDNDIHHGHFNTYNQKNHPGSSGVSGRKHHGPVEALKQMLFSLQTVQQGFDEEPTEQQEEIPENFTSQTQSLDFEEAPGSKSLQRALSHLKHLKGLVDDIGRKKNKEPGSYQYD